MKALDNHTGLRDQTVTRLVVKQGYKNKVHAFCCRLLGHRFEPVRYRIMRIGLSPMYTFNRLRCARCGEVRKI